MRALLLPWVIVMCGAACAATPATELMLSGSDGPPPESLVLLASQVRREGGLVFVGVPASSPRVIESFFEPAPYENLQVEFPRAEADVTVVDALGAVIDAELTIESASGAPRLVDDEGAPSEDYVLSGSVDAWRARELPTTGEWVFFVIPWPSAARLAVVWRAELNGDTASGAGTQTGADADLAALRAE
ncbi:MAG: hypothetical protein M3Y87_02910 [Myxococcota bacterium]|nr:hypothetical protein [Myxococcota bacterium]